MAVYDQKYKRYSGPLTSGWMRFLVIPRYSFRAIFRSKLFTALYVLCFAYPAVAAILIYLHHNTGALLILKVNIADLVPIDSSFFHELTMKQIMLGGLLILFIGPRLIANDLSDNSLPLYLSRPMTRLQYVLGKLFVLVALFSAITWVPCLVLFLFQSYLEGSKWLGDNLFVAGAILASSWVSAMTLSLIALSISAWIKWRAAATIVLLAVFVIPSIAGAVASELSGEPWINTINIRLLLQAVSDNLFRQQSAGAGHEPWHLPLWSAWAVVLSVCCICLSLLVRKIRAYDIVR